MPTKVISVGGVPTTVANMADVGGESYTLPAATTSVLGGVKKAATQADSVATDVAGLVTDFNALLAKLKAAGMM
ncbi:head fiber protein [Salmonella bongori]|uniref:head fiber protein n=1 Tax=Salmonella bongori TaxID=54736 RepID=UPI001C676922|nr:head fiber protein [Salmonella bongori]